MCVCCLLGRLTKCVIGSGVMGVLALQAADSNIPSEVLYLLKSVRYALSYKAVQWNGHVSHKNVHVGSHLV